MSIICRKYTLCEYPDHWSVYEESVTRGDWIDIGSKGIKYNGTKEECEEYVQLNKDRYFNEDSFLFRM